MHYDKKNFILRAVMKDNSFAYIQDIAGDFGSTHMVKAATKFKGRSKAVAKAKAFMKQFNRSMFGRINPVRRVELIG